MPSVAQQPYADLPLPLDGHGSHSYWTDQIKQAEEKRAPYKENEWDRNVQAYLGKTLSITPTTDTVTVPKDFANIERKKAELFFQNPDINLTASQPGLEEAVQTFQAAVNHYLGPEGVDAGAMMTECTFDACVTALMVSVIGYESFQDGTQEIPTGELGPDPSVSMPDMMPGAVLGIGTPPPAPPMVPMTQEVPNIIHERYFWTRVSPAKLLLPVDFCGFNYDSAPWLGYEFEDDWAIVRKRYDLPEDARPRMGRGDSPSRLKSERNEDRSTDRCKGYVIWYRANLYDDAQVHPDALRYLVLIDGLEDPVKHTDSPYQRQQPDGSIVGMQGFPVHVGALRYTSDTAYPAAESTVGRAQVTELGKSRTQMLTQRDRNIPMRMVDSARIGGEPGLDKIRKGEWQGLIPVVGLDQNNPPIQPVPQAQYPPEDFTFNSIISRDLDEVWAFGPNQRGLATDEKKTATEIRNIQSNVSARLDSERRQVIRYYVQGAEKLGALLQLFATDQQFVQIVGQDGTRRLQAWNKDTVAGKYVYDARPDSAVRLDAAQEFRDLIEMYNLTGRDPHVNRVEILTKMARLKNLDTQRFIVPQLPPKGPEPIKASLAIKAEQLDPRMPNFPILVELLNQAGYTLSPEAVAAASQQAQQQDQIMASVAGGPTNPLTQPTGQGQSPRATHGGTAPEMERLSKHTSDRSNELSGPSTRT